MTELLKINQDLLSFGLRNVAGIYALELARIAEQVYHIDVEELLTTSGLNKKQVEVEHAQIPCFHLFAMILNLVRSTQDQSVGLNLGKHMDFKAYHMLGYVLMNCKNLREGVARVIRYERLVLEISMTSFEEHTNTCIVKWDCPFEGSEMRYFRELVITGWVELSRKVIANPNQLELVSVHFSHAAPETGQTAYEAYFDSPVHFDEDFTGVIFNNAVLELPYVGPDPVLDGIMEQQADLMLQALDDNVAFLSEARAAIYRLMPSGDVSMERLAEQMRLSYKTLYTRFKRSGTHFSDLLDDVRRILSVIYLENPDINVLDVALLVGFTDQSSFSRAFKRWQKMSPGDYRKKVMKHESFYKKSMDSLLARPLNQPS